MPAPILRKSSVRLLDEASFTQAQKNTHEYLVTQDSDSRDDGLPWQAGSVAFTDDISVSPPASSASSPMNLPFTEAPSPPPHLPKPQQQQQSKNNSNNHHHRFTCNTHALLQVSVIGCWILVALASLYFAKTEHARRRRRILRQRQARLEEYSPQKQLERMGQLKQILKASTMVVTPQDFIRNDSCDDELECASDAEIDSSLDVCNQQNSNLEEGIEDHMPISASLGCEDSFLSTGKAKEIQKWSANTDEYDNLDSSQSISKKKNSLDNDDNNRKDAENGGAHAGGDITDETHELCCNSSEGYIGDASLDMSESDSDDDEEKWSLCLPTTPQRHVSALCIICFKHYQRHDQVSWSTNHTSYYSDHDNADDGSASYVTRNNHCPHAFHQACIVQWLAKLPNGNCPVCRNVFCNSK